MSSIAFRVRLSALARIVGACAWLSACAEAPVAEKITPELPPVAVQLLISGPIPEGSLDKSRGVRFSLKVRSILVEASGLNMRPVQKVFDITGTEGFLIVAMGVPPGPQRSFEATGFTGYEGKGQELYHGSTLDLNIQNRPGAQVPIPMGIVGGLPPDTVVDLPKWASADEALLQGLVNPNGFETNVNFEWGPTPQLGKALAPIKLLPAVSDQKVEAKMSGLTSASTYFYRLSATNKGGTTQTEMRYFKTQPAPEETFMRDLIHIKVKPGMKRDAVETIAKRYQATILEQSIDNFILKYLGTRPVNEVVHTMNDDEQLVFAQVLPFHSKLK